LPLTAKLRFFIEQTKKTTENKKSQLSSHFLNINRKMRNPIILRYVTQAWLKIVSFFKTIFNAKGSADKVGGKLHLCTQ